MSFSSGSCLYLSLFIYMLLLTFLSQSPMQVDDTSGPPAPVALPPMPPPVSLAPPAEAIPISHFLVGFFSRSSLLSLCSFTSLVCFCTSIHYWFWQQSCQERYIFFFFSLFFFLNSLFIAHTVMLPVNLQQKVAFDTHYTSEFLIGIHSRTHYQSLERTKVLCEIVSR